MRWPVSIEWTDDETERTYSIEGVVLLPEPDETRIVKRARRFRIKHVTYRGVEIKTLNFMGEIGPTKLADIRETAFHEAERDSEAFVVVYQPHLGGEEEENV